MTRTQTEPALRVLDYRATLERRHDYRICLPGDWAPVRVPQDPPDDSVARCMGLFVTASDHDANVEVRCAKIDWELDPLDLLELHLEREGATIVEKKPVWGLGGRTAELLVHRPIAGGQAATVARVEKDAELVYFVYGNTTIDGFASRADKLRGIVRSFRLLHPAGGLAEPLLPGGARFPVDHSFLFPASFKMLPDKTSNAALAGYELVLSGHRDRGGFMAIVAIARRTTDHENADEIAAWTQRALRKRGVELGPLVLADVDPLARELPTRAAHGEGSHAGEPAETELRIARHDQAWLVLARATPTRAANGPAWLAHRRAFTIAHERFAALPHPEA
jgi:hypothetical protein